MKLYNSYLKVVDKDSGAGMNEQNIEVLFNEDLSGNLLQNLWNRTR